MFRFKEFQVDDSLAAMKVGTDGVLLGAWAAVEHSRNILDVGTGSGLIALMVAQRSGADVVAVDISEDAVRQAEYNVAQSPWSERVEVRLGDIRTMTFDHQFDHIVSNPPYFEESLQCLDAGRNLARHTTSLSFEELVGAAERLLIDGGLLSVVLPADAAARFRRVAFGRLWLVRQLDVVTKQGETVKRTLMEFKRSDSPSMPRCETLAIHSLDGSYTDDYRRLTQDFYLKF